MTINGEPRPRPHAWGIGSVLAIATPILAGALLALLQVSDQQHRARLEADAAVRASVASAVMPINAAIQRKLRDAADLGTGPGATLSVAKVQGLPDLLASAVAARDSGRPGLLDLAQPPSILVPVYRSGRVPANTAERRTALRGYRILPLSLGPVVSGLAPAGGGLVVRGPHREAVAASGPMPVGQGARAFSIGLAQPETAGWVIQAWLPDPGPRAATWPAVLLLLALAGGLSVAGASSRRRSIAAAEVDARLHRQRSLVAGMAPVVQSSLDLGEVAPAVAAHLVHTVAGEPLLRADLVALATATELLGSTLAHVEIFARQQQVVERLRSVDELKTVFLATASHELRTPVTAIVGFSALLLDEWDALDQAQGRMFLERVLTNARELESLIEQLLDFSRLERGVPQEDHEVLDLGTTIGRILAERTELYVDHELRADLPTGGLVRGSVAAVERIVTNLVGNAAKYSPAGTRIQVSLRAEAGRVEVLVDDEGAGVSAEDREHVFSRFYRGHGGPVTSTRGAGIGLAIVAEYATSMGGIATVAQAPSWRPRRSPRSR